MPAPPKKRPARARDFLPHHEWEKLSIGEKIQDLLGYGLNDAYVVAHWPIADCNPQQFAAKMRQFEILLRSGMQFAMEAYKARNAENALKEVQARLTEALRQAKEEK